jgi:DNA-binding transcriptional LysR family regulator
MNFTRIGYFLVAAKYLNFTKAADVLYISQPSLSKQIALLEEELGLQLFDRTKRTLVLTSAGNYMYQEFSRLMPEMKSIVDKVRRMKDDEVRTLYLGCVETLNLGDEVTGMIRGFKEHMERIELHIERSPFDIIRNGIIDGSLDVAFTISTQIHESKDLVSFELEKRRRYIIISTSHRLASKERIVFEDLRDETFALFDPEIAMISYDEIFNECKKAGFFPKIRYAPNNSTIIDYLEMSGCIAFLDKSFANNRQETLKYYDMQNGRRFSLVCVWRKDNTNPALHEFIKYLPCN